MAVQVLTNAYALIDSVDLSDHVESVELTYEAEVHDASAMSDTTRNKLPGLKNFSARLNMRQNRDASKVDATMFDIVGTQVAVEFRGDAGAVSATNPKYTGNVIVTSYNPLSGSFDNVENTAIVLEGNGDLTRATS